MSARTRIEAHIYTSPMTEFISVL